MLAKIKKLVLTIAAPFLKLFESLKKGLNINDLMSKLRQAISGMIAELFSFHPDRWEDYFDLRGLLIAKKLVILIILLLCVAPIVYFNYLAPAEAVSVEKEPEMMTFYYNEMALKDYTGKAVIKYTDDTVIYRGDIAAGICSGTGTVYNRQGKKVYEGELLENKFCGTGGLYGVDGKLVYYGEFEDNVYNGEGRLWDLKTDHYYKGTFVNGLYEGLGKLYNLDKGEYYIGSFAKGKKNGEGILYDKEGKMLFQGTYVEDLFTGESERYLNKALTYVGGYRDGQKDGQGKQYNAAGKLIYEGNFMFGKRHGKGKEYDPETNRVIYEGEYVDGKRQGEGTLYTPEGKEIFSGNMYDGGIDFTSFLGGSWGEIEEKFGANPEIIIGESGTYLVYKTLKVTFKVDLTKSEIAQKQLEGVQEELSEAASEDRASVIEKQWTKEVLDQTDKSKAIVEMIGVMKDLSKEEKEKLVESEEKELLTVDMDEMNEVMQFFFSIDKKEEDTSLTLIPDAKHIWLTNKIPSAVSYKTYENEGLVYKVAGEEKQTCYFIKLKEE